MAINRLLLAKNTKTSPNKLYANQPFMHQNYKTKRLINNRLGIDLKILILDLKSTFKLTKNRTNSLKVKLFFNKYFP